MAPHDRDQFDDLLDGALRRYADVEPRAGLEVRVLANLAAETNRSNSRVWWVWAVAGATAIIAVVGMWIGVGHQRTTTPEVAIHAPVVKNSAIRKTAVATEAAGLNRATARARRTPALTSVAKAAEPRPEQFPSPRPLSQQEQLLIAYVTEFPKQAAEVAQEQTKRQKEFEAMYPVANPDSDSNQER